MFTFWIFYAHMIDRQPNGVCDVSIHSLGKQIYQRHLLHAAMKLNISTAYVQVTQNWFLDFCDDARFKVINAEGIYQL